MSAVTTTLASAVDEQASDVSAQKSSGLIKGTKNGHSPSGIANNRSEDTKREDTHDKDRDTEKMDEEDENEEEDSNGESDVQGLEGTGLTGLRNDGKGTNMNVDASRRKRKMSSTPSPAQEEGAQDAFLQYYANPRGGQAGLCNVGNTCFLNAGLQCLLHCPQFISIFLDIDHARWNLKDDKMKLAKDLHTLTRKIWSGKFKYCNPSDVVDDLWRLNPSFQSYDQQDSQELVRHLIDNLHEGLSKKVEYSYLLTEEERQNDKVGEELQCGQEHEAKDSGEGKKDTTQRPKFFFNPASDIADIFQGKIVSQVTCSNCGHVSSTTDAFFDLSLELPKDVQLKRIEHERGPDALNNGESQGWFSAITNFIGITSPSLSVETCLHSFCTGEQLQHECQYKCEKCKQRVDATKRLALAHLPEVLTLHVKRFSHDSYYGGSKINRHVSFPLVLDMSPFLHHEHPQADDSAVLRRRSVATIAREEKNDYPMDCSDDQRTMDPISVMEKGRKHIHSSTKYELFGVVKHIGGVSGGHYISFCKHHTSNEWYRFDDQHVTPISWEKVKAQEAYMLFYHRCPAVKEKKECLDIIKNTETEAMQMDIHSRSRSKSVRYLSRQWVKKVRFFNALIPVDNRNLCCPHGRPCAVPPGGSKAALEISESGWNTLLKAYGGGPEVDGKDRTEDCTECILSKMRERDRKFMNTCTAAALKYRKGSDPHYMIASSWLLAWDAYVKGGPRPGPVSNHLLFEDDGKSLKTGMKSRIDYKGLYFHEFDGLIKLFGGGPVIARSTTDIYSDLPNNPNPPVGSEQDGKMVNTQNGEPDD